MSAFVRPVICALTLVNLGASLVACSREAAPRYTVALGVPAACEVGTITEIRARFLGDFRSTGVEERVVPLVNVVAANSLRMGANPETLALSFTGTGTLRPAAGLALLPRELPRATTTVFARLLPFNRPCGLPPVAPRVGSAAVALPTGGALVVGGLGVERAEADAQLFDPVTNLWKNVDGFINARSRASVTVTNDGRYAVVTGGATSLRGDGVETFEVFDISQRTFDRSRIDRLDFARRDHSAAPIDESRVLVVGGRTVFEGRALTSAETIDLRTNAVATVMMPSGRADAYAIALDNGSIAVLGGVTETGVVASEVWLFRDNRFERTDVDVQLPVDAAVVALPGGRAAAFARASNGSATRVTLVLTEPPARATTLEILNLPPLSSMRAAALPNGRVFLAGIDGAGAAAAFIVDLNAARADRRSATGMTVHAMTLADGSNFEIADTGAVSVRRDFLVTAYDPLPNLIDGQLARIALDDPGSWRITSDALSAVGGRVSRFDVAPTLVENVELVLSSTAGVELAFVRPITNITVLINADSVSVGACAAQRVGSEPILIRREGSALTLSAGAGERVCEAPFGEARLALRAASGATIRSLAVRRLD